MLLIELDDGISSEIGCGIDFVANPSSAKSSFVVLWNLYPT